MVKNLSAPPCLGVALRRGILMHIDHFSLPKTELTPIEKNPITGIFRALISGNRQNGLRLGENRGLFDRKLLEYLHEQGSGCCRERSDSGRLRGSRDDLFRARCGLRLPIFRSGFHDQVLKVSTARGNAVLIDYFSKITYLHPI